MNNQLSTILDLAAAVEGGQAIILGVLDLYRALRDQFGAPPDLLTDAQLAQLLIDRGLALKVDTDHWLADHGFGPDPA
jgi:hypothetical protein